MPVAGRYYYNCNKSSGGWLGNAVVGLAGFVSGATMALLGVADGSYKLRFRYISHEGEFIHLVHCR
jgi:hypothetical protein